MKHINKRCPNCNSTIRLTAISWEARGVFWCPHCGTKLLKKYKKWNGISGYTLEVIE